MKRKIEDTLKNRPMVVFAWIWIVGGIVAVVLSFIGIMIWKAKGLIP
jgi:hypothetical protein